MTQEEFTQAYVAGFGYTVRTLRSKAIPEAEEWAQAGWCRAWEKRDMWSGISTFATWVVVIAVNLYIREWRKQHSEVRIEYAESLPEDYIPDYITDICGNQLLDKLCEKHRLLLEQRYILGLSTAEAANEYSIPQSLVRLRTHRIIQKLRERYV